MEYVLSAVWVGMEMMFSCIIWNTFFVRKVLRKNYIGTFILMWIASVVFSNIGLSTLTTQMISLTMYFVAIRVLHFGAWYQQFIVAILAYYMGFVFDAVFMTGACAAFTLSMTELIQRKFMYTVVISVSKLFSIMSAWIIKRVRKTKYSQPIERKWLLLMLLFPVVSLAMLMMFFRNVRVALNFSVTDVVFVCGLIAANIAMFYLFTLMEKSTMEARNAALLNQRMEMQTDSVKALEKSYREQRRTVHEFKNQLQVINSLLAGGNTYEAEAYIHQLQSVQNTRTLAVNSHHPIMDAVLNHKYQTAVEKEIDVQMQVSDLSKLKLNTDMLVVLLSNLWNNATEACERLENERVIRCSIIMEETLFISVSNTSMPVNIVGDAIPTTKENRLDHGYGIPQIKSIMKALNAEYTFSYESGWFTFVCDIPLA